MKLWRHYKTIISFLSVSSGSQMSLGMVFHVYLISCVFVSSSSEYKGKVLLLPFQDSICCLFWLASHLLGSLGFFQTSLLEF